MTEIQRLSAYNVGPCAPNFASARSKAALALGLGRPCRQCGCRGRRPGRRPGRGPGAGPGETWHPARRRAPAIFSSRVRCHARRKKPTPNAPKFLADPARPPARSPRPLLGRSPARQTHHNRHRTRKSAQLERHASCGTHTACRARWRLCPGSPAPGSAGLSMQWQNAWGRASGFLYQLRGFILRGRCSLTPSLKTNVRSAPVRTDSEKYARRPRS